MCTSHRYLHSDRFTRTRLQEHPMWFCENGVCSYLHSFPGTCRASQHVLVRSLVLFSMQGFGLQIGLDLYLLFDLREFHHLQQATSNLTGTVKMIGFFIADNDAQILLLSNTFVFTNAIPSKASFIVLGCYCPPNDPWYLRSAPFWAQFFIVPIFSVLSSLANLRPVSDWKSRRNLLRDGDYFMRFVCYEQSGEPLYLQPL
jgi:hypothetical protein